MEASMVTLLVEALTVNHATAGATLGGLPKHWFRFRDHVQPICASLRHDVGTRV